MTYQPEVGLVLWTTDIPALATFLEKVGGLVVEERHPGFAELSAFNSRIVLHHDEAGRGHPWYDALTKEGAARGIGAELRLLVQDVDAAFAMALKLGGRSLQPPADVGGVRECQVMGPNGYLLTPWAPIA